VREEERDAGSWGFKGQRKRGFRGKRKREKVRDADKGLSTRYNLSHPLHSTDEIISSH